MRTGQFASLVCFVWTLDSRRDEIHVHNFGGDTTGTKADPTTRAEVII